MRSRVIVKFTDNVRGFLRGNDGAVTVDWVVLTAALIGIGMIFLVPIAFATDSVAMRIGEAIGGMTVIEESPERAPPREDAPREITPSR